jgi:hypothetical protein
MSYPTPMDVAEAEDKAANALDAALDWPYSREVWDQNTQHPSPQVTPDGGNRQLADCERQRDRGMFCLMEMMQAYERRIRSACTTPEQLAAKPWECAEYIKAARYMVACKAEIDAGRLVTMSEQNATPVNQWQPIETAPKQRKIIVHYLNPLGKHRTVMACYYGEKSLEMHDDYDDVGTFDEESGTLFADAGWYEEHDSDDPILPLGGVPTHWMPLPPPPVITLTVPVVDK